MTTEKPNGNITLLTVVFFEFINQSMICQWVEPIICNTKHNDQPWPHNRWARSLHSCNSTKGHQTKSFAIIEISTEKFTFKYRNQSTVHNSNWWCEYLVREIFSHLSILNPCTPERSKKKILIVHSSFPLQKIGYHQYVQRLESFHHLFATSAPKFFLSPVCQGLESFQHIFSQRVHPNVSHPNQSASLIHKLIEMASS